MGKRGGILPNVALILTFCFFWYTSRRTLKTSVELLTMVISVTKHIFFYKASVFFPFLGAHYRALEGKAIAMARVPILAY